MKTLAELKRNANAGHMALELLEWYGETGDAIPERLRGIRRVKRANSVGLILENASGADSEMRIEAATLVECDGEYLTIYQEGKRPLNDTERRVIGEALKESGNYYDGSELAVSEYWTIRSHLERSVCPWLNGDGFRCGKRYDPYKNVIHDRAIKGEPILKYKVHWI